jgi:outer membrane receptor protein involved in Fe transport
MGDANLKPESSDTFNIGILLNPTDNITASIDYWSFDFTDIIGAESGQTRVTIENIICPNKTPDCRDPKIIRNALTGEDPNDNLQHSGEIVRVISQYINAPGVKTDGVDVDIKWTLPTAGGEFTVRAQGSYLNEYTISGLLGLDATGQVAPVTVHAVGSRNDSNFARPLPRTKANLSLGWAQGSHRLTTIVRYISDYEDDKRPDHLYNDRIDSWTSVDLHYNFTFDRSPTTISLSLINVGDEEPPFADQDLNYDARTHDPFGRMFQVVVRHQFGE